MSRTEDDMPVPPDETEPLEEGDAMKADADTPVKGDAVESLPLSIPVTEREIHLSENRPRPAGRGKQ